MKKLLLTVAAVFLMAQMAFASVFTTGVQLRTNNVNISNAVAAVSLATGETVTVAQITLPDATVINGIVIAGANSASIIFFGVAGVHGVVNGAQIIFHVETNLSSSDTATVNCSTFAGGAGVLCF